MVQTRNALKKLEDNIPKKQDAAKEGSPTEHGYTDRDKDPLNPITHPGPDNEGNYRIYKVWKSITDPKTGKITSVMVHWEGWNQDDSTEERIEDVRDTDAYEEWRQMWKGRNKQGVYEIEEIIGEKEVEGELWVKIWWAGQARSKAQWRPASYVVKQ